MSWYFTKLMFARKQAVFLKVSFYMYISYFIYLFFKGRLQLNCCMTALFGWSFKVFT